MHVHILIHVFKLTTLILHSFPSLAFLCIIAHYCIPASTVKTPPSGSIPTPSASKTTAFPPQFTSKSSILGHSSPLQYSKTLPPETKVPSTAIGAIKQASGAHANSFYGGGGAAAQARGAASDDSASSSDNKLKHVKVTVLSLLLKQIARAMMKLLFMNFL